MGKESEGQTGQTGDVGKGGLKKPTVGTGGTATKGGQNAGTTGGFTAGKDDLAGHTGGGASGTGGKGGTGGSIL